MIIVLWGLTGALAQEQYANPSTTGALPPASSTNNKLKHLPTRSKPSLKDSYAAISPTERMAIQSDLVWAGHYRGPINGEFSDQLVAAVKAFQKQNRTQQTGVLNPQERAALAAAVRPAQEQVGWRVMYDPVVGARVGVPSKLAPRAGAGPAGSLWSSAQGQIKIETFRLDAPGTTLASVLEHHKNGPDRKIVHQAVHAESFVLAGLQGLKKFHVRAFARNGEVRGIAILYDQAMDGIMDPLVAPIAFTFLPFASNRLIGQDGTALRRKVEYGTGLVVSAAGHIVTHRQLVEGCQLVRIPGLGHAEQLAEDNNLALLRVYGARDLAPLALLGEPPRGANVILVGVADPQAQGGGDAVSTVSTRWHPRGDNAGALEQAPVPGFAGAAVLDKEGRFFGMVDLNPAVVAGAPTPPRASVIAAETIRNFLDANYLAPASGRVGIEDAKAAVVRVICVR